MGRLPAAAWFRLAHLAYGIRAVGWLVVLCSMPFSCATCVRDPINPKALQHQAFCAQYYQEGSLVEAEARCKLAREYAPKYAEPVNSLGLIAYTRGQKEIARNYFKEAIALRNDFAEAHNNIGALFLEERNFNIAANSFINAIEVDPGFVNARVNLALCRFMQERYADARNEYIKCLELEPKACDCRAGLGHIAVKEHNFEDAKLQFQRMTEICPEVPSSFYHLCQTYLDLGQCGAALEACIKAVALKSDYIEARKNLTVATECIALEDQAVQDYIGKIAKSPGNAELHFNLGVIYREKNLLEAALNEFLSVIKIDPSFVMAYYQAAKVYDAQLNSEQTITMCQAFVDRIRGERHAEARNWCIDRVKNLQYN